jgi:hypothetical protein
MYKIKGKSISNYTVITSWRCCNRRAPLIPRPLAAGMVINYYQTGYNPDTKGIAIICGNIIVTYNEYASPELIAQTFSISLVDHFPDMKVAIFSVPSRGDIFVTTDSINLVVQVEIEVLENEAVPL